MIKFLLSRVICYIAMIVMSVLRIFLDGALIRYGVEWWWRTEKAAQDGNLVQQGVSREEIKYGREWRENGWILSPSNGEKFKNNECMLFIHGGGWSVANSHVLIHSMTPFVRKGYTVLAVSYPLAPYGKFPAPIISMVRALQYAREEHGVKRVHIHGDSAGGNIGSLVAAFTENPLMMKDLCKYTYKNHSVSRSSSFNETESLPAIVSVTSVYGIHDQESWFGKLKGVCPLESLMCSFLYSVCLNNYKSSHMSGYVSVCDWMNRIKSYPKTLLICGSRDPLIYSSATFHWALKSRGFDSKFITMSGARHAYFGFPPCWGEGLLGTQQQTFREVVSFMEAA